jgi:hypothetical protein
MKLVCTAILVCAVAHAQNAIGIVTGVRGEWRAVGAKPRPLELGAQVWAGDHAEATGGVERTLDVWLFGRPAMHIDCRVRNLCARPIPLQTAEGVTGAILALGAEIAALFERAPKVYVPTMTRGDAANGVARIDGGEIDLCPAQLTDGECEIEARRIARGGRAADAVEWRAERKDPTATHFPVSATPGLYEVSIMQPATAREVVWVLLAPAAQYPELSSAFAAGRKALRDAALAGDVRLGLERAHLEALARRIRQP